MPFLNSVPLIPGENRPGWDGRRPNDGPFRGARMALGVAVSTQKNDVTRAPGRPLSPPGSYPSSKAYTARREFPKDRWEKESRPA